MDFTASGESEVLSALINRTELQYAAMLPLSQSSFEADRRAGVAIVSRYPVGGVEGFFLPNPGLVAHQGGRRITLHDKGVVTCTVEFGQAELTVASLHFFPLHRFGRDAREPAFSNIWQSIDERLLPGAGRRFVLCGDFNTEDRSVLLDSLHEPLTRAFAGRRTHNGKEIDDILFSAESFYSVQPELVPNFSDHDLCVVELIPGR